MGSGRGGNLVDIVVGQCRRSTGGLEPDLLVPVASRDDECTSKKGQSIMNSTLGRIIAAGGLVGALALASAAPTQAAGGRNAAFAAGVAAGVLGGAVLGGGYAPGYGYPAYGYPGYGYPVYGGGYYAGPRYVRPYRGRRYYHYYR